MKRIEDDKDYLIDIPKSKRKRHKNTLSFDVPCLVNANQVINQVRHEDNVNQKNRVEAAKRLSIEKQIIAVNAESNKIKHIISTPYIKQKAREAKALKRAEAIAKHHFSVIAETNKIYIL